VRSVVQCMSSIYLFLTLCSAALFAYYGIASLASEDLTQEFDRWGVGNLRRLTAFLELSGAVGLLIGLVLPIVALLAATGLCLMMLIATGVRIRIRDPFYAMIPAIMLAVINAYIAWNVWTTL